MEYIKDLYLSGISDINSIKCQLDNRRGVYGVFCICIDTSARRNLFEIIHTAEIFKEAHSNKKYLVVGIASGKKESFTLVASIIQDYISAFKNLDDIRQNFIKRMVGLEAN